jgi:RimJ/RimL family protein N-acetyltransferase
MAWERIRGILLENDVVRLRPIEAGDVDQFRSIAFEPDIWRYFVFRIETEEHLERFIQNSINDHAAGIRVALAVIARQTNRIAGSMSFGNMAEEHGRLEIGWSWLGRDFRGTRINKWSKYLMLAYAFEDLACERVEFKTDALNARARQGLLKIGAKEEGTLRSYNLMPGNRRRDAVYYSILKHEWPEVKRMLRHVESGC